MIRIWVVTVTTRSTNHYTITAYIAEDGFDPSTSGLWSIDLWPWSIPLRHVAAFCFWFSSEGATVVCIRRQQNTKPTAPCRFVGNHVQFCPKVTGTIDTRHTLRHWPPKPLHVGAFCWGKANPDLSLNQYRLELRVALNLHLPKIHYFVEGRSAK